MKKILLATLIATAFGASTSASAATTALAVSATIQGVCKFQASSSTTLAFGTIDPSIAGPVTATANIDFKCTKGTVQTTLTATSPNDVAGVHKLVNGANSFTYSATFTNPGVTGTGFGAGSTLTSVAISGSIAAVDYANAPALVYADTLTFTVAP